VFAVSFCGQGLEPGRGEPLRKHACGMFLGERSAEALRCNFAKRNCIKSRRPHQSTQCLFCDGKCGSTSEQFRKAKLQYGQKHSRLARLERVAILLVSSCSTTLLHLPQAAQCREPSPVVRNALFTSCTPYILAF